MEKILVLNSGSTTVKFQLFQMNRESCLVIAQGVAERIGLEGSKVTIKAEKKDDYILENHLSDHKDAIKAILDYLLRLLPNLLTL